MSKRPTLRFKGRYEDWEQQKIGEFSTFSKGAGYSKADIRTNGVPLILYGRLYTKYETVIREVDTFAVPKEGSVYSYGGEVIVPASGESAEDISIASVVENSGLLLGGDLNIITPNTKIDPAFLALSISHGKTHFALSKLAQGKTIVHIHNADIQSVDLRFPKKDEQKDISGLFIQLDDLIIRYQRKYDKLLTYKKAMLEKMFPKDGADVPEVRFAGFANPWTKCKLSQLLFLSEDRNDGTYTRNDVLAASLGTELAKKHIYFGLRATDESVKSYKVVKPRDVIYTKSPIKGFPNGIIRTSKGAEGIVPTLYCVYHSIDTVNPSIIQSYFESRERLDKYLMPLVNIGARNNVNITDTEFLEGLICIPHDVQEQTMIVEFLERLSRLITFHQLKLDKLTSIKKALLDKMFV